MDVRAAVIRTQVLNDVVLERRVAGVCLRHTHAVLHEQLDAVRRQLLGVQLQAHVERSADGEVVTPTVLMGVPCTLKWHVL